MLALSITFPGGSLSNLPPSQFFNFNDLDVMNTVPLFLPSSFALADMSKCTYVVPERLCPRHRCYQGTSMTATAPFHFPPHSFFPQNCGDTNDACLCSSNATIPAITSCHQCVFGDLIHKRKLASDPREDSTPALTGEYCLLSSCFFSITSLRFGYVVYIGCTLAAFSGYVGCRSLTLTCCRDVLLAITLFLLKPPEPN